MKYQLYAWLAACVFILAGVALARADERDVVSLPAGVQAVWEIEKAFREATPTRERVCLNGLWRWQPVQGAADRLPEVNWGYFKVPGCWPGITDYQQKDCQTVLAHPSWKETRLGTVTAAWHQRAISIPDTWDGRRIGLSIEYLNSYATVYVDGKQAGELRFPGGTLDLTPHCRPGAKHVLSLYVLALPLKGVLLSYADTNTAREVQGRVPRRGLCGDVFLIGEPAGPAVTDVKVETSVRKGQLAVDAILERLIAGTRYKLRARVVAAEKTIHEFSSQPFTSDDVKEGHLTLTDAWKPEQLWDIHTPQNTFELSVELHDAAGQLRDTGFGTRFGFREFWIDGRDFYVNGTRIYLSAVPLDNALVSAALASYAGARESLERLKSFGINFVYTHNYGCEPGAHLSFAEILRAADDVGMLVALTQPHFSHYDWQGDEADSTNGYARHAAFYSRVAASHPSVVAYATSHNATGYDEDMNPEMIDGLQDPRSGGALANVRKALRAEAIIRQLDSSRIVYHHSSGNLGSMHTSNFYPNFVPIQELSDWFEHWATSGVKPVFLCEYGAPFSWDWGMYRGWYRGERSFGSAKVPWDFCLAEWNAQFLGDSAFQTSEAEKANLRWEARQFGAGSLWNRWDYPQSLNSKVFDERYTVIARYLNDNWRAFRTWGVSAISPWEHEMFWKLREGVDRGRRDLTVDWQNLQRPGFSADYLAQQYERMDMAFERRDWLPTAAAHVLIRNNGPLLAFIGGKRDAHTEKSHLFTPGDTVEKQLIVINNSRETVVCKYEWTVDLPAPVSGAGNITVATGERQFIPWTLALPNTTPPGTYRLTCRFDCAGLQTDSFAFQIVAKPKAPQSNAAIALFDPKGETATWLRQAHFPFQAVTADTDLARYDLLIVGKSALTVDGPAPDIARVRDGLRVLVFEQGADVLEKRFGFRVVEYGLRQVFARIPDHPILTGMKPESLQDWRGSATLTPSRLTYESRPRYGPTVKWCDIPVSRVWRCGNRGNVASVLIEKPARGDFLPIVDGGFSLQYSPLMEYREGTGMILFCQLDVTGRTETDPVAAALAGNILQYASAWKSTPRRSAVYAGNPSGKSQLESLGIAVDPYEPGVLTADQVLVVGPGGGESLTGNEAAIAKWLKAGGKLLALGIDQSDADKLPLKVVMNRAEHISAFFEPFGMQSPLAGVGPADVHNRDPRELGLVTGGAKPYGDGVLAVAEGADVVFCQMAPWQFGGSKLLNLRKTFRRTSFLMTRVLANMGVAGPTPIVARFHAPVSGSEPKKRWEEGLYADQPEEWDDPYRFFRW